jgi:predicted acetyltransferase
MSVQTEAAVIRPLTPDDDLGQELWLARRAFGPFGPGDGERRRASWARSAAAGLVLGAFRGETMVASARYLDTRQWWRGRSLPMAAVAGVKVAPHAQGTGLGRDLMTALLRQMAGQGYPLSALYPTTAPLYRSLGWELAGARYEATVPARSLRTLLPPDPALLPPDSGLDRPAPGPALPPPGLAGDRMAGDGIAGAGERAAGGAAAAGRFQPAGPGDAAAMISVLSAVYAAGRDCGPVTFDAPVLSWMLDQEDVYVYLAPDGALGYQWDTGRDEMLVHCAAAGSAATAAALWSIVSSHGTMVRGVRAFVAPADPLTWLTREPDVTLTRGDQWMLRLLDAPAAIAGRGFPAGARASAALRVTDPQLPANSGDWRLEVSGGAAALSPAPPPAAGPPALRLGARGLAALYAGTPLATLRRAGLAAGGTPAGDEALDDAFAATPYMTDYF